MQSSKCIIYTQSYRAVSSLMGPNKGNGVILRDFGYFVYTCNTQKNSGRDFEVNLTYPRYLR